MAQRSPASAAPPLPAPQQRLRCCPAQCPLGSSAAQHRRRSNAKRPGAASSISAVKWLQVREIPHDYMVHWLQSVVSLLSGCCPTRDHTTALLAVEFVPWSCQSEHLVLLTRTWCSFEILPLEVQPFCLALGCRHRSSMHSDIAVRHGSVQLVDCFPDEKSLRKCQSVPNGLCQYCLENMEIKVDHESKSSVCTSVAFLD